MSSSISKSHTVARRAIVQYFTEHSKPGSTLSPMYQRILGTVAAQVEANKLDWLVEASSKRTALETSLLLTAGMHRQVLLGEAQPLNEFYPNVGGGSRAFTDPEFGSVFLNVMEDCKDKLIPIIRDETVQTNETQRGLFWLFPAILTGWEKIHLVDLGASAGLNLVADQRRFTFDDGGTSSQLSFGLAAAESMNQQFVSNVTPSIPDYIMTEASSSSTPTVVSRNGCDLHPFPLETEADRAKLESFMWPDQGRRFERLHEAVEAHQRISETQTIAIQQANLPHDLPAFLESLDFNNDNSNVPVLIYNTYMTTYLEEQGRAMRGYIDQWASSQKNRKVMWVQSEPNEESPIKHHWCAWTVDLWDENNNEHRHWQLSWAHPHGTEIEFLQGLDEFASFFKK